MIHLYLYKKQYIYIYIHTFLVNLNGRLLSSFYLSTTDILSWLICKLWEPYFINLYLSLLICYSCSHSPCTCHNSFKVCPSVCLDSYNIGPVAHTLFSAKISFLHSEMCHPFYCIDVKFVGPRFSLDFMMCIHPTFTPPLSQLVRFFRLPQLCAIPHNAAVSVLGHIPLPVWEVSSSGFPGAVCMGHRVSVLEFDDELPGPWWNGCLMFFFHLTNNVCIHLWCPVW
jgi:hypothetical protein